LTACRRWMAQFPRQYNLSLRTASRGRRSIPRQLKSLMSESAIDSDPTNRGLS
jgi:hypothetical protein